MSDSRKSKAFVVAMTAHIKRGGMFEKPSCDNSGVCMAANTSSKRSNCIYCGKELVWKNRNWWTWDSDLMMTSKPQNGEEPK